MASWSRSKNMKTFSVIIGIYNHLEYLPKLVESLEKQTWKDFEVIFCDDGSNDGTEEWFKGRQFVFPHKYIRQKNRGMRLSRNLNNGMKVAEGKYFVLIMGDSFPETDYLFQMASFKGKHNLVCGVRVQVDKTENSIKAVDVDWRLKKGNIPNGNYIIIDNPHNAFTGNGLMFPRELYEKYGGWDEEIEGYGGDDCLFVAKAYFNGYICWSVATAVLYHYWHKNQAQGNNLKYINKKILEYATKK